jgi:predicted nucleic acid-binding protein
MDYLLATNIPSEARKRAGNRNVKAWRAAVPSSSLFLSVVTVAEIRKGIVRLRKSDKAAAQAIEAWLAILLSSFGARVLEIDRHVAEHWGAMPACRSRMRCSPPSRSVTA